MGPSDESVYQLVGFSPRVPAADLFAATFPINKTPTHDSGSVLGRGVEVMHWGGG